jgi:pyruvate dehydrogenase (quinone)
MKTDPEVPPLPPHITLDQAKKLASTLIKGDPNERRVLLGAAKELLASVLPGHRD